jgi:hypothetical protein
MNKPHCRVLFCKSPTVYEALGKDGKPYKYKLYFCEKHKGAWKNVQRVK